MSDFTDVYQLVSDWANRTEEILKERISSLKIGVSDELYSSIRNDVYQRSAEMIGVDISFLNYGRFRDMNVGRKPKQTLDNSRRRKQRIPKKWYSKTFYGRLNALNGVVMASMAEESIQAITKTLK